MNIPLGIWGRLDRPFSVLAPMEDVTDTVFRRIVLSAGAPDLLVTEFTSTDGLCTAGRPRVIGRLRFTLPEKPLVAQIWGNDPERYRRVASEVREMGFDGVDINMGCPVKKVVARGSCSALIRNPSLAAELVAAAKEGAGGTIPVSVKTRIGITQPEPDEWLGFLLAQGIAALTVHGRTAAQQSDGLADWTAVSLAVKLRDAAGLPTRIVGNGDVRSAADFQRRAAETGADGIMIGRGIFENLFVFRSVRGGAGEHEFARLSPAEKVEWFQRHIDLHEQTWGAAARFDMLKKFAKTYLRSFEGASRLVDAVMHTHRHADAREVLSAWLSEHPAAGHEAPAAAAVD